MKAEAEATAVVGSARRPLWAAARFIAAEAVSGVTVFD